MKTLMALTALLFVTSAHAESWKFNCGKTMNVPRVVTITPKAPGQDGYNLKATYQTRGSDPTTGMLSARTYKMVGGSELTKDESGKEIPVLALISVENVSLQLVIGKTSKVGAKVPGVEVDLKDQSTTEFTCVLASYKK